MESYEGGGAFSSETGSVGADGRNDHCADGRVDGRTVGVAEGCDDGRTDVSSAAELSAPASVSRIGSGPFQWLAIKYIAGSNKIISIIDKPVNTEPNWPIL